MPCDHAIATVGLTNEIEARVLLALHRLILIPFRVRGPPAFGQTPSVLAKAVFCSSDHHGGHKIVPKKDCVLLRTKVRILGFLSVKLLVESSRKSGTHHRQNIATIRCLVGAIGTSVQLCSSLHNCTMDS